MCDLLTKKYGDLGDKAGRQLHDWLSGNFFNAHEEILKKHLDKEHVDLVFDAFWQVLPFGTGGRRGRVGYGPNRVNPTTVAMTVQGHCDYLNRHFEGTDNPAVVVANDVRIFNDISGAYDFLGDDHPLLGVSSRSLGKLACQVYAANGFVVYFESPHVDGDPPPVVSTPMLSYAVNELGAMGGINLSASHNHPDDNGIKVYDQYGSQPVAPDDQHLVDAMAKAEDIKVMPFEQAWAEGMIRGLPSELNTKYLETYLQEFGDIYTFKPDDSPVVYTPLCGCGLTSTGEVLKRLGVPFLVPPRQGPDGTFKEIPFRTPNPEVPQSTAPAKAFAEKKGSLIVLSSDPDADRIGLEARLPDGQWYHFDGNQIATMLCYFLMLDPDGPRRRGLVIETLVTTRIIGKIVEKATGSWIVDDLLVGFKHVADVLKTLGRDGRYQDITCLPDQLVLAAEESHGIETLSTIRDKDSTPACMYLAALHQKLIRQGRSFLDYYCSILDELGGYDDGLRSIMLSGAEGMIQKDNIMRSLREEPFKTLGGHEVRGMVDHWDQERFGPFKSDTDRLPRNVLRFITDAAIVTVRPSGTEPKLKFYVQRLPHGEVSTSRGRPLLEELRSKTNAFSQKVYNELLARIDLSLGEPGLLLPDIVDLAQKQKFENETVPELHQILLSGKVACLEDALAWLREKSAAMTPGADPLPAVRSSIAAVCHQWEKEAGNVPLLNELAAWAAEQQ